MAIDHRELAGTARTCAIIRAGARDPGAGLESGGVATAVLAPEQLARPRWLVIAERLPRPDESSGSCRFLAILAQLACRADVDLWVELDEREGPTSLPAARVAADRRRLEDLGVRVLSCRWRALRQALRCRYDAVFFEFYHVAARYLRAVRDEQPTAVLVVDSVDVHYARLAAGVAVGAVDPAWARQVYDDETATYRAADAVVVVSSGDIGVLGCEPGMPDLVCVPNCVTIRPRPAIARAPEAIFVGHFHHAPNLDGVRWFVREGWPRVRQRHAGARLTVIGSYAGAEVHALGDVPGVDVVGYVPELQPYLDRAAVAVAPLRFGAGMKGKVTDALAAGLPVVTTSIGAQGLEIVHGRHAWVADDATAFADAVADVLADPAAAAVVGAAGQAYIDGICGPEAVGTAVDRLLRVPARAPAVPSASGLVRRLRLARLGVEQRWLTWGRRVAGWQSRRPGLTGAAP